jgi:hypothetical protein
MTEFSLLSHKSDKKVQDYLFHIYLFFIWVWSLVSHVKGRIQIESVWEQGAEENILI